MKTLVLANQKGGVGKSAVATQLAFYLASQGRRVLFLDLDHQQNSTRPIVKSGRAAVAGFTASQLLLEQAGGLPQGDFVLVKADDVLSTLERQPDKHNALATALKKFLADVDARFDVCIIDTNPNPDIRYAAALIVSHFVLSPIQLNQEAIDGISSLLNHQRYGYRKIKKALNPALELIGILPNMVEPTPFQRENFKQLVTTYASLLIVIDPTTQQLGFLPKRSVMAEAQAEGAFIPDIKKTAARDAWREIKPVFDAITERLKLEI